jgi:hypothetical protein
MLKLTAENETEVGLLRVAWADSRLAEALGNLEFAVWLGGRYQFGSADTEPGQPADTGGRHRRQPVARQTATRQTAGCGLREGWLKGRRPAAHWPPPRRSCPERPAAPAAVTRKTAVLPVRKTSRPAGG